MLIQALSRDSIHVRRGAVHGLREARDPAASEALILCLSSDNRQVRSLAVDALVAIGPPAADAVNRALDEERLTDKGRIELADRVLQKVGKQAL